VTSGPGAVSFWLTEPSEELPQRRFEGREEVAVIGGGVTGCACALTLAERGVRVRLYEAREVAGGASGRNGGFAGVGAAMPYDEAVRALGSAAARLVMVLTLRSLSRMEKLAGDAFRRTGTVRLAEDETECEALRREHDALRQEGFPVEWIDELDSPLDTLYRGAVLHPENGALHPARWVRRLATRAAEAGADICERQPVGPNDVPADAIVVACDGFTGSVLPELAEVVRPTRGQVVATEPLAERLFARPHHARYSYDYWQQLPDGRLVIGGSRDFAPEAEQTDLEETTRPIQARIDALVERLVGYRPVVAQRWAGIWGMSPDSIPLVGRVPGRDGVWVAGGYSGHGNVMGLACGDLVARALLGEQPPELQLFEPARLLEVEASTS
jgi:gamma-glutamylputrescine oxidase